MFINIFVVLVLLPALSNYELSCDFLQKDWLKHPRLYLNKLEVVVPTAHGFKMIVDSSDSVVSQKIMSQGSWQPQLIFLISRLVLTGDVVLNLGAQTGLQAIVMGKVIEKTGKMYVFEPYSLSYRLMVKNIYLNGLQDITKTYRLGAGMVNKESLLKVDSFNTGHSSIVKQVTVLDTGFQKIQVVAVDQVLSEEKSIDFALIDVQDYQIEALMGMKNTLRRSKSSILLIEWSGTNIKDDDKKQATQLLNFLQKQGFLWYRYIHKESQPCSLGRIQELQRQALFDVQVDDLLLAGPQANLKLIFGQK